jgi:hypothetical protein
MKKLIKKDKKLLSSVISISLMLIIFLSGCKAQQPTTPVSLQAPGFEDVTVHTVCLKVEQSYPEIEKEISMPIFEVTQRILERLGLKVVTEGEPGDAILTITLIGKALGADYRRVGYCYSGAEVSGKISLAVPEHIPFDLPISKRRSPPFGIIGCPKDPSDAPFRSIWPEPLLDGLASLWGSQICIKSLGDEELNVINGAISSLAKMGEPVVEPLIQALKDKNRRVRVYAPAALGNIGEPALEPLIQALKDEDWRVREGASVALGRIGDKRAIEPLIQTLNDKNDDVKKAAEEALEKIKSNKNSQ